MPVYVISDGTGETAEKVVRAALRQFRGQLVHVHTFPNITDPDRLNELLRQASRNKAMVVTTLVSSEMRQVVQNRSRTHKFRHLDLLGALLDQLESYFGHTPAEVPGLLHEVDERYFQRIEAVEFTVKADDGKDPRMLRRADIVLVGVSRTSKTPLSTFLAHKGYKVANVPLVLERPPPPSLFEVEPFRVFGLIIEAEVLREIRHARLAAMGLSSNTNYSDMGYILAELEQAQNLFRGNPEWPIIDVTNRAVEETASIILRTFQARGVLQSAGDVGQL
ncbi:MAG: kinase/pyrophosphorylase [Deltaproteobacteria bacterium]|nr:MAG: kinase/pyrophosphorylase [Deltaproteobacteria bacterium]